jgi:hypothetical protein
MPCHAVVSPFLFIYFAFFFFFFVFLARSTRPDPRETQGADARLVRRNGEGGEDARGFGGGWGAEVSPSPFPPCPMSNRFLRSVSPMPFSPFVYARSDSNFSLGFYFADNRALALVWSRSAERVESMTPQAARLTCLVCVRGLRHATSYILHRRLHTITPRPRPRPRPNPVF